MANFEKTTMGCFGITAVYIVPALALLLIGITLFGMPVNVLIGCLVWIVVCLAVSIIYPNAAGLVLTEFAAAVFFAAWSQSIGSTFLLKDVKDSSDIFFAYALPFIAAVILWHIGTWIRSGFNENEKYGKKLKRLNEILEVKENEPQEPTAPMQAVEKPAVEVIEAEPAPEPVQGTAQTPDADEEMRSAEEARRKAEEAQKQAEEARQRVEEAQKRAERAAQKMEDAMKRAKLAQEQLKKAQAEAEKLKNQNKKT